MAADVRQGRSFRNLDFIPFVAVLYRRLASLFFSSNSEQEEGGKNGKRIDGKDWKKRSGGIFWARIYSGESFQESSRRIFFIEKAILK